MTATAAKGKSAERGAICVTVVVPRRRRRPPFVYRRRGEWFGMSVRAAVERVRNYPYGAELPVKLNGVPISSRSMHRLRMGDKLNFI